MKNEIKQALFNFLKNEESAYQQNTSDDFQHFLDVPISEIVRQQLYKDRVNYTLQNGSQAKFNEPKILLDTLFQLIKKSIGFRIYAGFDGTTIFPILCLSDKPHDPQENTEYYILKDIEYLKGTLPEPVLFNDAKQYLQNYFTHIKVNGAAQIAGISKKSRFYSTGAMVSYLSHYPDVTDYQKYCIKLEFGYITQETNTEVLEILYSSEFPVKGSSNYTVDYHTGYTIMLNLQDLNNKRKLTTLEIGHPCPPQCGR